MIHTKFSTRSNEELMRLAVLSGCSQLEIELALRLSEAVDRIEELVAQKTCGECRDIL